MKATQEFSGVKAGDVYPSTIAVGDDIPAELEEAAVALACVSDDDAKAFATPKTPAPAPADDK